MRTSTLREKLTPLAILLVLTACDGKSTGKSIPLVISEDETIANGTFPTANPLTLGTPIHGEVNTAGDVDTFAIQLSAGTTVMIELFGTRLDQGGWDGNGNVPRLTLFDTDTATVPNAKLLEQDYSGNFSDGWGWGTHDLDIPRFRVPATGKYYIAVTQDNQTFGGGEYILRASSVSLSGSQQEAESAGGASNDDSASAQSFSPGTMHGYHVSGEDDYYKFTVGGPTVVRFELSAYRNGVHEDTALYFDTYMRLYDTDGTTQLDSDDDSFFYDSAIQYEIKTAGTYFIRVEEYDPADGEYFLTYSAKSAGGSTESEPNDDSTTADSIAYGGRMRGTIAVGETDFYKFSGTAGDMVFLQAFDSANSQAGTDGIDWYLVGTDGTTELPTGGDDDFQTITTILQETGTFYVKVEGGSGTTPYAIELKRYLASTYETEPNNIDTEAGTLSTRVSGVIEPPAGVVGGIPVDVDMYRISLTKDRLARFTCYASNAATSDDGIGEYSGFGSDLAPKIELLDSEGTVVASSTSTPAAGIYAESVTQPLPTCTLATAVAATGTYFVRVSSADALTGPTQYYLLEYANR